MKGFRLLVLPPTASASMGFELRAGDDFLAAGAQDAAWAVPAHRHLSVQQYLPLRRLVHDLLTSLQQNKLVQSAQVAGRPSQAAKLWQNDRERARFPDAIYMSRSQSHSKGAEKQLTGCASVHCGPLLCAPQGFCKVWIWSKEFRPFCALSSTAGS